MKIKLTAGWFYGGLVVALSVWILHSFLEAVLAACVTAVASWPLYTRFARRVGGRLSGSVVSLLFTMAMVVFVLAPLVFAFGALLAEANALLHDLAAADTKGVAAPAWLEHVPMLGRWLTARWEKDLDHAGALALWVRRTDASALLGWAQSMGQFLARHVFITLFAILALYFLYQQGESLARNFRQLLAHHIGARAEGYLELATRSLRASVNSMLLVGLFDGVATGVAYVIADVPQPAVWAAITGSCALVPFLGYVAVMALGLRLALLGATTSALIACSLGCLILFTADKVIRTVIARHGTRLHFVWVLMACLGGFEVLGLVGLVIGPVVLSLAKELWMQRVHELVEDAPASKRQTSLIPSALESRTIHMRG
jgi:predicted PurR-regulated permease PerM